MTLAYYSTYLNIKGDNICSPFADCIDLESEKEEYEFEKPDLTLADARLTGDEINIEGMSLELSLVFLTENQNESLISNLLKLFLSMFWDTSASVVKVTSESESVIKAVQNLLLTNVPQLKILVVATQNVLI